MGMILTEKTIVFRGRLLHQIRGQNGEVGGYVESLRNIVSGWVEPSGKVFDDAVVDGGIVFGVVCGSALVYGGLVGQSANVSQGVWNNAAII